MYKTEHGWNSSISDFSFLLTTTTSNILNYINFDIPKNCLFDWNGFLQLFVRKVQKQNWTLLSQEPGWTKLLILCFLDLHFRSASCISSSWCTCGVILWLELCQSWMGFVPLKQGFCCSLISTLSALFLWCSLYVLCARQRAKSANDSYFWHYVCHIVYEPEIMKKHLEVKDAVKYNRTFYDC